MKKPITGGNSNSPDSVLARLKDKLNLTLGIDIYKLKALIDQNAAKSFNGKVNSKVHFDKSNAYQELTKDKISIKVFFKYLLLLNLDKARISVTITTKRGKEYTVYEDIKFLSPTDDIGEEE